MDNNTMLKRFLRGLLIFGVLAVIAVLIGLFFAFGGNNPLLIHASNIIDMILIAIMVLFIMGLIYKVAMMVTGAGQPRYEKSKNNSAKNNDDMPELMELIENLDATEK